ncbi:hypothetical protein [Streptomyces sulphureus]|uniref:hypothetical protein n=1 Tax=Streptomyces sulphureus TaxID=47758 RepID=UPI00036BC0EB|nr:hypothetical protein [Streptomyces sulphureus]
MRTTTLRRAAVVAVLVPAVALPLAACSSGDDDGSGSSSGGSSQEGGDDGRSGGGEASGKPLTGKELKSALLKSGEAGDYRVRYQKDGGPLDTDAVQVNRRECQPIVDLFSPEPAHARAAYASAALAESGVGTGGAFQQVVLSSYEEQDGAAKTFGGLRTAVGKCDGFVGSQGGAKEEQVTIEAGDSADVGVDAVQFTMRPKSSKAGSAMSVTVVRTAGSTATFASMALEGGKAKPMEGAVVREQHRKLEAAEKG